jgi:hypothetical protein
MKPISKITFAGFLALTVACGTYPERVKDDLKKEKGLRETADQRNADLEKENQDLSENLQKIYVTDNYLWIWAVGFGSYDQAAAKCLDIDYSMPTPEMYLEFEAGVLSKNPTLRASADKAEIHIVDETRDSKSRLIVCGHPKN